MPASKFVCVGWLEIRTRRENMMKRMMAAAIAALVLCSAHAARAQVGVRLVFAADIGNGANFKVEE
jgi:predicted secreted hydrolase